MRVHFPKQNPEELPFLYNHCRNRLSILTKQKNKDELPKYITKKRNEKLKKKKNYALCFRKKNRAEIQEEDRDPFENFVYVETVNRN